jgi:hypothetical protein
VLSFRVDADYRDPMAGQAFRPFRVVHRWAEGQASKAHAQTITRLPAKYTIPCAAEPDMVSVAYEMPAAQ